MKTKYLKKWAKHLIEMANKCDNPIIKAFILGKADTVGLNYLERKDNDEDFRNLLLENVNSYYNEWYKMLDKYL